MTKLDIKKTNETANSCKTVDCKCRVWWDILQQSAYLRLCHHKGGDNYHLEENYEQRARRIAATYAQIYLEIPGQGEDRGNWENSALRGRYYWMGLGAFASKVVGATFNSLFSTQGYAFNHAGFIENVIPVARTTRWIVKKVNGIDIKIASESVHIFARGNLWLFMDIAPWHWCWSASPDNYRKCAIKRNSENFNERVKKTVNDLPWADECLKPMGQFKQTDYIKNAFELVESMGSKPYGNPLYQYKHLIAIANQEQRQILQKICWDDSTMIEGARAQREIRSLMPVYMLFHHDYERSGDYESNRRAYAFTDDDAYSEIPKDKHAEIESQRMEWIIDVADKYHQMMQYHRPYMEHELRIIAGWGNSGSAAFRAERYSNDPE
jgi:hypothetical protein